MRNENGTLDMDELIKKMGMNGTYQNVGNFTTENGEVKKEEVQEEKKEENPEL